MFRDNRQLAAACRAIASRVGLGSYWTADGPTEALFQLVRGGTLSLSRGESIMVRASADLWNGAGKVSLSEVLEVLDGGNTEALCTLVVAASQGADAVDAWLATHGGK